MIRKKIMRTKWSLTENKKGNRIFYTVTCRGIVLSAPLFKAVAEHIVNLHNQSRKKKKILRCKQQRKIPQF